jgi:hypothetical protein
MLKNEEFYFSSLKLYVFQALHQDNRPSFLWEEWGLNFNFSPKVIIPKSKRAPRIPLSLLAISLSKLLLLTKAGSTAFYDIALQYASFLKIASNHLGDFIPSGIIKTCTKEKLYTLKYNLNK